MNNNIVTTNLVHDSIILVVQFTHIRITNPFCRSSFFIRPYFPPDFSEQRFHNAPDAVCVPAPFDGVAPEHYHAMSIFPEYFKVNGQWLLAEESRMDCVAVYENGRIIVREFRLLRKGDLVFTGRTEDATDGIYVHPIGFREEEKEKETFAFRQNRSRETAFSRDYDELYDLLRHERDHGKIVWVMGPAFAFDHDARAAMAKLIENGYVHAILAGNALAVLYRMAGSPAVDAPSGFTDVADGQWYSDAIAWAAANGIVNGVGGNKFAPSEPVTREQLAAIFFRYAKAEAPEADVLSGYPDAESVSTYARDAMAWAVSTGLVTGSKEADGTYLAPQGLAAREQAAAILMRYVKANA